MHNPLGRLVMSLHYRRAGAWHRCTRRASLEDYRIPGTSYTVAEGDNAPTDSAMNTTRRMTISIQRAKSTQCAKTYLKYGRNWGRGALPNDTSNYNDTVQLS